MSQYRKRTNDGQPKEMSPFTSQSQMYITVSQSDKNKGRYYYGYDGQWLKWVDPSKLGGYLTSLQTDGKKWFFAPGVIDPDCADKLTLTASPPMIPVGGTVVPLGNVPQSVWNNSTAGRMASQQTEIYSSPPPQVKDPNKDLIPLLTTLNDHLSDLSEYVNALVQQIKELNQNKKVDQSLKRQKMLSSVPNLEHTVPGSFTDDAPDSNEPSDNE